MMKLTGWDVYGSLIRTGRDEVRDDRDSEPLYLRKEVKRALEYIDARNHVQVTFSDGDIGNQKRNLQKTGLKWADHFLNLYQFAPNEPKDPQIIIEELNKLPLGRTFFLKDFVAIGDNWKIDIELPLKRGCQAIYIPEEGDYSIYDRIVESGFF